MSKYLPPVETQFIASPSCPSFFRSAIPLLNNFSTIANILSSSPSPFVYFVPSWLNQNLTSRHFVCLTNGKGTTSRDTLLNQKALIWLQALPASYARTRARINTMAHLDSKRQLFQKLRCKLMNVMKTTYKNISLLQKGYPTPFWIAYSNSRIGKHKPASFTRTGSIIYTANSSIELNMDCILNLTQMHFTKCLLWTQLMIAGMPDQREGNYIQAHVALLTRPNKAAAPG